MPDAPPIIIAVYDKALVLRGYVGDPVSVSITPRHNGIGTASVEVDADHRRLPDLTAPGARLGFTYQGQILMTGQIRTRSGQGASNTATVTLGVEDDFRLLSRILAWPNPSAALTAQTSEYDVRSGAAETVLKAYVAANVSRLGLPVDVAGSGGAGASIKASLRFEPLTDQLVGLVDAAGIGVTVRQQPNQRLLVDTYVPRVYPIVLSERSGVVREWEWSQSDPSVTRVVAGGAGTGTGRLFAQSIDNGIEGAYGDVIEAFLDATDATTPTDLTQRAADQRAQGVPKTGLKVTLAETATFAYGTSVRVGDRVQMVLAAQVDPIVDVLREATLSWSRDEGFQVVPTVGERTDDTTQLLARAISALARGYRSVTTRR